jgi:hypothetical protein
LGRFLDTSSGERMRPASFIAARSSACVGSLIGDLTDADNEDADGRPHNVVALLTDEKVVFSGDGSSLAGSTSKLGVEISLSGVDFGLSTAGLAGKVGSGREKRDGDGAGDDDGEAGFGISTCFGNRDFCDVLCDPETRLSKSNDVGFLGTPGEEVLGELIDSGRGEAFVVA